MMKIKPIDREFSICRLNDGARVNFGAEFWFAARTDNELSLVCETKDAPNCAAARDDGWAAFRIEGTLDFSLVGILAKISSILAENEIGIFAVSTYDTDYILTKKENFSRALEALAAAGYDIV